MVLPSLPSSEVFWGGKIGLEREAETAVYPVLAPEPCSPTWASSVLHTCSKVSTESRRPISAVIDLPVEREQTLPSSEETPSASLMPTAVSALLEPWVQPELLNGGPKCQNSQDQFPKDRPFHRTTKDLVLLCV